jgi:hypothetical protein
MSMKKSGSLACILSLLIHHMKLMKPETAYQHFSLKVNGRKGEYEFILAREMGRFWR